MDITPFVYNRAVNLIVSLYISIAIVIWMVRNKDQWLYLFPALFWSLHGLVFYVYWLLSYFGVFGLAFILQAMNDWGSVFASHGLWTLAIIVSGLLARFFNKFVITWVLVLVGVRGG